MPATLRFRITNIRTMQRDILMSLTFCVFMKNAISCKLAYLSDIVHALPRLPFSRFGDKWLSCTRTNSITLTNI